MPAKILYVEDEIIIRVLVKRLLADYDVTICHTAAMAMDALRSERFDVILIDINLGLGINGIELCREIRATPGYDATPMGAVTAQWINTKEELFLEGFTHYLPKPFDREQIIEFVETMLAGKD
jgi:CheY-like chemotaxis protein